MIGRFGNAAQIAGAAGNVVYYAAKEGEDMPYTVDRGENSLKEFVEYFEQVISTPEGRSGVMKDLDRIRQEREAIAAREQEKRVAV